MIKKTFNQDVVDALYEIFYLNCLTNIYPPANNLPKDKEYTINLLWINLNPQDRKANTAQNIFNEGLNEAENHEILYNVEGLRSLEHKARTKEELALWNKIKNSFMYKASLWADLNKSTIHIWYDSALVTKQARDNTTNTIKK